MQADPFITWAFSSFLLSLRIAPVLALAPPFTLTKFPPLFRALFGLGMAACIVSGAPSALITDLSLANLVTTAVRELMLGAVFVMAFQLAFGAIYLVGRTIDIQAGYGLAAVIDPTTRTQTPLIGTFFALAAGMVFFAVDGHAELLRIFAASLEAMPLGTGQMPTSLARLTGFISVVFVTAFGVGGGVVLSLFLADLGIAALSRTVPQMNVLVLGFQLKTLVLLVVLPATFGLAGSILLRLMRVTLDGLPGLF